MCQKFFLKLRFGDADLKDAHTGGDGDPDGIKVHDHPDNSSV